MTTQQLECFIRVADKLNFTKAAQEMFLTTPTVTHHIKSLEEELGAALFIRTPKMVQLTDAGAEFYGDAKDILNKINLSSKKIANVVSQSLSYIRIGCTSNAELKALKPALKELRKCMPDIYPMLFLRDYSRLKTMFESGHIDIMLVTKDMIENTDCTFKPIKNMKSYALISDDYNKTTEDNKDLHSMSAISFDDLKGHCLLLLNQRLIPFTQGNLLQEKLVLHSQDNYHFICENSQTSELLAQCGYGIAILPEFCIDTTLDNCRILPITDQREIQYGIAYNKTRSTKDTKKICNILTSNLKPQ